MNNPPALPASSPWTVVVTGPGSQEIGRYPLRPGFSLKIGRSPDSHVMIGVMTVSRNHGRIELGPTGFPVYHDEPGAQGTKIDGDPVEGSAPLGERTELTLAGYRFTLTRTRTASPTAPIATPDRAPAAAAPSAGAGDTLLDRYVAGVRTHRSDTRKEEDARALRFDTEWNEVVRQARQIQVRYGRHPLMLEFGISKDEREILVKIKDRSPRGYAYFCLARQHPEGRFPEQRAVWLREVGRPDDHYEEPLRGLEELFARIAPRMA